MLAPALGELSRERFWVQLFRGMSMGEFLGVNVNGIVRGEKLTQTAIEQLLLHCVSASRGNKMLLLKALSLVQGILLR